MSAEIDLRDATKRDDDRHPHVGPRTDDLIGVIWTQILNQIGHVVCDDHLFVEQRQIKPEILWFQIR
jgi:hypothetical protein